MITTGKKGNEHLNGNFISGNTLEIYRRISGRVNELSLHVRNVLYKHAERFKESDNKHSAFPPPRHYHQHFILLFMLLSIH